MAGQGEIEIVAAEQKVLADGGSLKLQLAVDEASAHQAEVGRAAADVADQNQFAIAEVFSCSHAARADSPQSTHKTRPAVLRAE